jgi:hypothetical protein
VGVRAGHQPGQRPGQAAHGHRVAGADGLPQVPGGLPDQAGAEVEAQPGPAADDLLGRDPERDQERQVADRAEQPAVLAQQGGQPAPRLAVHAGR